MARNLGVLIFDDVEELDFVGPWEVFGMAVRLGADFRPMLIAPTMDVVRSRYGLRIMPDLDIAHAPPLDILLVPGGLGARTYAREDPEILQLVQSSAKRGWVVSVCTGALVLGAAGVLKGRRATTHASALETLRESEGVEVVKGERWVIEEPIATSAGVSAGIDLALELLARWCGDEMKKRVAQQIEWQGAESKGSTV
jgi:transcriptional regulator GlxA family with amidase domain